MSINVVCLVFAQNDTLTTAQYMQPAYKIDHILSVKQDLNVLTISGCDENVFVQRKVTLGCENSFTLKTWNTSWIPQFAVTTIPLRFRFPQDTLPAIVSSGIANAGLTISWLTRTWDTYYADGKKVSKKLNAGLLVAPSIEEISPENTKKRTYNKSKQLFISTGFSINYSYNDIAISFIVGKDIPTTLEGKKYVYTSPWIGFGIGLNTKFFARN